MTGDELFDYVKTIGSRKDFIGFVKCLNDDYREKSPDWENGDLQSFLSGLAGFATDMDGYYKNMGQVIDVETISWRMVAEMLLAATVYEN